MAITPIEENTDNSPFYEIMTDRAAVWNTLASAENAQIWGSYSAYNIVFTFEKQLEHQKMKMKGIRQLQSARTNIIPLHGHIIESLKIRIIGVLYIILWRNN